MINLPPTIRRYFEQHRVTYRELHVDEPHSLSVDMAELGIDHHLTARAVLLKESNRFLLVVLPFDQAIDFTQLKTLYDVDFQLAEQVDMQQVFVDCDPETVPPLGAAYGIDTLVDTTLMQKESLFLQPGRKGVFLKMPSPEFKKLFRNANVARFSCRVIDITNRNCDVCPPLADNDDGEIDFGRYMPAANVRRRLDQIYSLPAVPTLVEQLLILREKPDATLDDLVDCLAPYPELSEQIKQLARATIFSGHSAGLSLRDTIQQLLGFRMALHIALGFACLRAFQPPEEGPLGRVSFWRHALYTAMCALEITRKMPRAIRPESGQVFLATLLHNIGFLLLSDLFRPEFFLLNKLVEANPDTPITRLEYQVLGMGNAQHLINMGHPRLGAWLMYAWKMPDTVVMAVAEHHNLHYTGPHAVYSLLSQLADRLISSFELGDADEPGVPESLLSQIGITPEIAEQVVKKIQTSQALLDAIVF